jgi:long-chain acyl-CoA synthetase
LSRDLQEIKPQYLTGVPRVFEKIYAFAMQTINEYSPAKKKVFNWAVETGKKYDVFFREQSRAIGLKKSKKIPRTPLDLLIKLKLARSLVFDKILVKTGGNLLCFLSGGASLPIELARFYGAIGVTILEGYGLTETSPVTNVENPIDVNYGMVGPPLTGTEEKIGDDGEVLVRGPQIFQGYWNKPEQTREAIDEEGWFHTGDLGKFDENGNLHIVGRKKEIFVLSTGKKVPPITVEELVATSQFMQQLVLQGDGRKFISAVVTPNFDMLKSHVTREMSELADKMPDFKTASQEDIKQFLEITEIRALFQQDIDKINEKVDPFDQVKKFVILPFELSEATGDITPSLKFKRAKIYEHYHDQIEAMYGKDQSVELSKGHDVHITENNKE